MTSEQRDAAIARVDREQEEIRASSGFPAWLVMLGDQDWENGAASD